MPAARASVSAKIATGPGGGTVDAERLKRPERKLVPVRVRPRVLSLRSRNAADPSAAARGVRIPMRGDQGVMVSTAVFCPPRDAVMVAEVLLPTREVVTSKFALVAPSGRTTLLGGCAAEFEVLKKTADPPGGDGMLSVTVPTEVVPPLTVDGLRVIEE